MIKNIGISKRIWILAGLPLLVSIVINLVAISLSIGLATADMIAQFEMNKNKLFITIVIINAVILTFTFILSIIIIPSIANPIKMIANASRKLAVGDTNVSIVQKTNDEIGQLMGAFGDMVNNIVEQSENAQKIAKGDISIEIVPKSENDILSKSLQEVLHAVRKTHNKVKQSIANIELGSLREKSRIENSFEGGWKDIASGMDRILDKYILYLDSLPVVIMTIDRDFNVKYLNKTGAQLLGLNENERIDKQCFNCFNTTDCNTEKCACGRAMKEEKKVTSETTAQIGDMTMHISYTGIPIINENGNITGAFEVVMDQTQIKKAQIVSEKQTEYQKTEVEKLIVNLGELAKGHLEIKTSITEPDADTKELANNFRRINDNLESTTNIIKSYIKELSEVLASLADKNFDIGIDREYLGDFKELKDSINYIIEHLNSVLIEINSSAEQVEAGADQVASSSQSLSQGASEQASSVEEIGATVTEVADQTNENAQNANKANDLSMKAKSDAEMGNVQMQTMLSAMDEIKESSKNIANIIKVIDEIAFQTNILALNAAVEAARAGEHGKGFAVVAEEVRNLAARSAQAAKETTDLIDNSIDKVDEGYKIANDTAAALNKIVSGVGDTVDIVSMIAEASNHQATAISEINRGIEQISDVTQSNTATAEESASASEEMAGQAQMLKGLIQEFKLKNLTIQNTNQVNQLESIDIAESIKEKSLEDDNFGKY